MICHSFRERCAVAGDRGVNFSTSRPLALLLGEFDHGSVWIEDAICGEVLDPPAFTPNFFALSGQQEGELLGKILVGRRAHQDESLAEERIVLLDPLSIDPKANEISLPLQAAAKSNGQLLGVP